MAQLELAVDAQLRCAGREIRAISRLEADGTLCCAKFENGFQSMRGVPLRIAKPLMPNTHTSSTAMPK
jgi:hypothetical protein